jgi:Ca2+/H+ antiporter
MPRIAFNAKNTGSTAADHYHAPEKIPVSAQLSAVLLGSWINALLLAVPVGFAVFYGGVGGGPWLVFVINFIAIIPLAAILSDTTKRLAIRVDQTLGCLLNASFGYVHPLHNVYMYICKASH